MNVQAAAAFHDGKNGGDLGSSLGATNMDPVLAANNDRAHRTVAWVIGPGLELVFLEKVRALSSVR